MQRTFGPLIVDIAGTELQQEERELIEHPLVGGVILFARNYQSPAQLFSLTQSIRAVKDKPLLVMVDQEGGRVQRFKTGFTKLPPLAFYGKVFEDNASLALLLAETTAWVMAFELILQGIDLSLSPVLDLNKGISTVIGDRAFHQDSEQVIKLADAFIRGMKAAGMAATGKHFPGHGAVASDSHQELPVDLRSFDQLANEDLQPFIYCIKNKIPALMTAHILFPSIDKQVVSFSRYWLHEVLREQLHYEGVIMSDDLDMKGAAIAGDYADRVCMARDSGCDLVLLCNNRAAVTQVLDRMPYKPYLLELKKYELLRAQCPDQAQKLDENQTLLKYRDLLSQHYGEQSENAYLTAST